MALRMAVGWRSPCALDRPQSTAGSGTGRHRPSGPVQLWPPLLSDTPGLCPPSCRARARRSRPAGRRDHPRPPADPPRRRLSRLRSGRPNGRDAGRYRPAGLQAAGRGQVRGDAGDVVDRCGGRSGPGRGTGPGLRPSGALVLGRSRLVLGGRASGPGRCWSRGPSVVRSVRRGVSVARSMWASAVPIARTGQAGHQGRDGPRRPRRSGLGQQVVGHLPGHA
jgi:hypothetical protein